MATRTATIASGHGLHARPAAIISEAAGELDAEAANPAARALTGVAQIVAARMSVRAAQAAERPVLTVS